MFIVILLTLIIVYNLLTNINSTILSHDILENMVKSRKHHHKKHKVLKNIYGKPLKKCRRKKTVKNNGSWDNEGYCSEMGGGVHQICFDVDDRTKNFSSATYQSDWSTNRVGKNHCMCLGAWALYKTRQKKGEIDYTANELVCDAIPETALTPQYINKWNTWNGHERENQILDGLESLYQQCYEKGDYYGRNYLKNKYSYLRSLYM